jgi:hypothetical protein
MLPGFVDSLLQTFENCRPGLSNVSTMNVNEMVNYLLGKKAEAAAAP